MRRMDKSCLLNDCGVSASRMRVCVCVLDMYLYTSKRDLCIPKRDLYIWKRDPSPPHGFVCVCVCVLDIYLYTSKRDIYVSLYLKKRLTLHKETCLPLMDACVCVCVCVRVIYIFIPQKETYTPKRDPYVSRLWKRHVCGITAVHTRIHEKVRVL